MAELPRSNRAPHPYLLPVYQGAPLRRGIMRLHGETFNPKRTSYFVHFLFNPQQIDTMYTTNTEIVGAQYLSPVQLATINKFPGSVGLSFALLFDRSFELMYDRNNTVGVLEDVAALERMLEMDKNGVILPNPIQFFFGGRTNGRSQGGFYFYGFVQTVQVSYTKFNRHMVPMRCVVSLTAQQLVTTTGQVGVDEAGKVTGIGGPTLGVASQIVAAAPPPTRHIRPADAQARPTAGIPSAGPGGNPSSIGIGGYVPVRRLQR